MTDPIVGTVGTNATDTSTSTATRKTGGDLDKEAFLKLLVAQLKYQDPSSPLQNTEFMTQTAQFTMVEKLTEIADTQQYLLTAQTLYGASSLVGKTVSYLDDEGATRSGVVTSATIFGSSPTLKVGNTDVPLSSVMEVQTTAG